MIFIHIYSIQGKARSTTGWTVALVAQLNMFHYLQRFKLLFQLLMENLTHVDILFRDVD